MIIMLNKNAMLDEYAKYLTEYLEKAENTVTGYRTDIAEFLETNDPETCTNAQLNRYFVKLKIDKGFKSSTVHRKIASVQGYFKYLVTMGFLEKNESINITRPSLEKKVFKCPEIGVVLDNMEDEDNDTVRLGMMLMLTARRIGEVVSIDFEDLDLDNERVFIREGKTDASKGEWFGLNQTVVNEIKTYVCKHNIVDGKLLRNRSNKPFTTVALRKHFKDKPFNPHTLRHISISGALAKGATIAELKQMSGHKTDKVLMGYCHAQENSPKRVLNDLF